MKIIIAIVMAVSAIAVGCFSDDKCWKSCKDASNVDRCVALCEAQKPDPGGKEGVGGQE